jgi:guanylate kinase
MADKGMVVVISAPSGAGKSTLTKNLLRRNKKYAFSVSVTTRPRRVGEVQGRDYYFVSLAEFQQRIRRKEFVEWARVHGEYYGTSKKVIRAILQKGKTALLDIDVQGGRQIKRHFPGAVMIFIMPPSFRALKQRLVKRKTEDAARMRMRIRNALDEVKKAPQYTYLVINDTIPQAMAELESILLAEACRIDKRKQIIKKYINETKE